MRMRINPLTPAGPTPTVSFSGRYLDMSHTPTELPSRHYSLPARLINASLHLHPRQHPPHFPIRLLEAAAQTSRSAFTLRNWIC